MILVDFSAMMHQNIFSSIKTVNPKKENGKFKTCDFINYTKFLILETLFDIQNKFNDYGKIVLCLDNTTSKNWRKTIYRNYKATRKSNREQSEINYSEVFNEINKFINVLKENSPYKVVSVESAEGDDVILCLARQYANVDKIMIISSDKDMIQAQKFGDVKQFSLLTKKFITPETKGEDMDGWLIEHVILGDACDEVPRIIDQTVFSEAFTKYLKSKNINMTPKMFHSLPFEKQSALDEAFRNKFNEDIFKKERFGISTFRKKVKEFGSLEKWLDSNEMYKENYERNKKLVLAEYIPTDIFEKTINMFKNAKEDCNFKEFKRYLEENQMQPLILEIPNNFCKVSFDDLFNF